ncbi:hypothetical protein [Aquincola tertiaricarbonis]|uniref:hypothetical protein n=1 Tax=Aquincola tertiaricarbonis TaxID=391953 RepID=UPI0012ECCD54|nr:hypothetical protein [Aquincola tertiaricarbonis]
MAVEVRSGLWQLGHDRTKELTTSVHAGHRIKAIVFSLTTTVPSIAQPACCAYRSIERP